VLAIVDEQIEVFQEVLTKDASDSRIGRLQLGKLLDHNQCVRDGVCSSLNKIQIGKGAASIGCHTSNADGATGFQVKSGSQRGLFDRLVRDGWTNFTETDHSDRAIAAWEESNKTNWRNRYFERVGKIAHFKMHYMEKAGLEVLEERLMPLANNWTKPPVT
jgi:hypothetical protein